MKTGVVLLVLAFLDVHCPACWGQSFPTEARAPGYSEGRALLRGICPVDDMEVEGKRGLEVGCGSCPGFLFGRGDPTPEQRFYKLFSRAGEPDFRLRSVIYGSFTRPGVQEAIASFDGCEPHYKNFGGTALLKKTPLGWLREGYFEALITTQCLKYPLKDSRDILLCEGQHSGQGEIDTWLFTYDFAQPDKTQGNVLISLMDTISQCDPGRQVVGSVKKIRLHELNREGSPGLTIFVSAGWVNMPAGHETDCPGSLVLPPVPIYRLDFLFGGSTFDVAPWSKQTASKIESIYSHYLN